MSTNCSKSSIETGISRLVISLLLAYISVTSSKLNDNAELESELYSKTFGL
jgi:hypothetical protein